MAYFYPNGSETDLVFSNATYNLVDVQTVVSTILNTDGYTFDVLCVYPINGQYGVLPRTLFYALLVFSLVFRSKIWISAACLASAMVYSGTAAIHALSLASRFNFKQYDGGIHDDNVLAAELGDLDMNAIWVIVSSGCLMLTPIINWSTTIRKHARVITVYWGLLLFTGLIVSMIALWGGHHPYMELGLATCFEQHDPVECDRTAAVDQYQFFNPPKEFWLDCNCVDTCDQVKSSIRVGTSMTPYVSPAKSLEIAAREPFSRIQKLNEFFIIFVLVQGVLGLLQSHWSQRNVRNSLFTRLAPGENVQPSTSTGAQFMSAKVFAAAFYLFSVIMAICCPAFFVINLVIQETLLFNYPISEPYSSVGQWSSWTSLGLAVAAAFIDKFHRPAVDLFKKSLHRVFTKQSTSATAATSPVTPKPLVCAHCRLWFSGRLIKRLVWEAKDFRSWWRNPVDHEEGFPPGCICPGPVVAGTATRVEPQLVRSLSYGGKVDEKGPVVVGQANVK
ncbi:MAG: hypothetical protein Q9219_003941 [cf. Caloplaca sp. 3 TL-2023]